jgi:sulfur carrier protein ThiS
MEEETTIKNLLQQYGIEETSSAFNNNVMQRINADVFVMQSKPLLNGMVLKLLKIIFLLVVLAIVACVAFNPPTFSVKVNSNIYRQLFSFIIVFWITMLINIWLNKRWTSKKLLFL